MTEIIIAGISCLSAVIVAVINNIQRNKRIETKLDDLAAHEKENYLGVLRLTVMASEMPDSERIIAGKKYIDAGGNGDVKHFYHDFLKSHTASGN